MAHTHTEAFEKLQNYDVRLSAILFVKLKQGSLAASLSVRACVGGRTVALMERQVSPRGRNNNAGIHIDSPVQIHVSPMTCSGYIQRIQPTLTTARRPHSSKRQNPDLCVFHQISVEIAD